MRAERRGGWSLALSCLALSGCSGFADGRPELARARAGEPRYVHEVSELGDPRVPAGPGQAPGPPEAIEALRPWLSQGGPRQRLSALEGLRRLSARTPGLIRARYPDLFDAALTDEVAEVRWRAAWAIGRLELARPGLVSALRDPDPRVAERAAWAIGRSGDPGAVPLLIEALEREAPVPATAEAALARLTFEHLGRDPAAWRAWLAQGGRAVGGDAPLADPPAEGGRPPR